ncbi:50S ribosomal protein P1, partial [Candidatus Bathyarchaeota archaeon]|nr:50S ribosomal protein P1 [Candidatus Bathyarchaeota archaeon]
MEYIYAALLLHRSGQEITEEGIKRILQAANLVPDEARVKSLIAALSRINIDETLKGVGAMPFIGAPMAAGQGAPASVTPESEKKGKVEEKEKEAEEKEKKEEEALEGL